MTPIAGLRAIEALSETNVPQAMLLRRWRSSILALLVSLAGVGLAVAQSPLEGARTALERGDTAQAVRYASQLAYADSTMGADAAAAFFLLQWIGRSPTQLAAAQRWQDVDRLRRVFNLQDPARMLLAANHIEAAYHTQRLDAEEALLLLLHASGVSRFMGALSELVDGPDSLLSGAAAWVAVQYDLYFVERALDSLIPDLQELPAGCARRVRDGHCILREAPPPEYTLAGIVAGSEALGTRVERLRANLRRAVHAPWPYSEFAARAWVVVETYLGDASTLRGVAGAIDEVTPRARSEVRVIAAEFTHRRRLADAEMDLHPDWYEPLDGSLGIFGETPMAPELFWRVAWPLYLEPYNARRVAHRGRLLLADAAVRLTATVGRGPIPLYSEPLVVTQHGVPLAIVRHVGGLRKIEYLDERMHETLVRSGDDLARVSLDLALAARDDQPVASTTGYVSDAFDAMTPFDHQVVRYVRDGAVHVDVHARRPLSPFCDATDAEVGFFLLGSRLGLIRQVVDTVAARVRRHRFRLVLAPGVYVYSLEMLDRGCAAAARARYVLSIDEPPNAFGLSDLMLAEALRVEEPRRLVRDQPMTALPSLTVAAGGAVHFYWEVYGIDAAATGEGRLDVGFEVVDSRQGKVSVRQLRRMAETVERTRPQLDLDFRAAVPEGRGPIVMGVTVEVAQGTYGLHVARLRVTDRQTGETALATRAFYVRPGAVVR